MPDQEQGETFLCAGCLETTPVSDRNQAPGDGFVCSSCRDDVFVCNDCEALVWGDDTTWIETGEYSVCDECRTYSYFSCGHCDQYSHTENSYFITDAEESWCGTCAEEEAICCDRCEDHTSAWFCLLDQDLCGRCLAVTEGEIRLRHQRCGGCPDCDEELNECDEARAMASNNHLYRTMNQETVRGVRVECYDCGRAVFVGESALTQDQRDRFNADTSHYRPDRVYCLRCRPTDTQGRVGYAVRNYSHRPEPRFKKSPLEKYRNVRGSPGKLYFGVEVEVEVADEERISMNKALADLAEGDRDEGLFYCKSDGSIHYGFEIVSHPFTFQYMKQNDKAFDAMFRLRDTCEGYRPTNCGMHVHMSVDAFTSLHMYKFIRFFYDNPEFIKRVSRRTGNNMERWAACQLSTGDNPIHIAKRQSCQSSRYSALNFQTRRTVECRIFRSTISRPLFYGNIEFLKGVYDYTKDSGLKNMSVDGFISHAQRHGSMFNNFLASLDMMTPRVEAEGGDI